MLTGMPIRYPEDGLVSGYLIGDLPAQSQKVLQATLTSSQPPSNVIPIAADVMALSTEVWMTFI